MGGQDKPAGNMLWGGRFTGTMSEEALTVHYN